MDFSSVLGSEDSQQVNLSDLEQEKVDAVQLDVHADVNQLSHVAEVNGKAFVDTASQIDAVAQPVLEAIGPPPIYFGFLNQGKVSVDKLDPEVEQKLTQCTYDIHTAIHLLEPAANNPNPSIVLNLTLDSYSFKDSNGVLVQGAYSLSELTAQLNAAARDVANGVPVNGVQASQLPSEEELLDHATKVDAAHKELKDFYAPISGYLSPVANGLSALQVYGRAAPIRNEGSLGVVSRWGKELQWRMGYGGEIPRLSYGHKLRSQTSLQVGQNLVEFIDMIDGGCGLTSAQKGEMQSSIKRMHSIYQGLAGKKDRLQTGKALDLKGKFDPNGDDPLDLLATMIAAAIPQGLSKENKEQVVASLMKQYFNKMRMGSSPSASDAAQEEAYIQEVTDLVLNKASATYSVERELSLMGIQRQLLWRGGNPGSFIPPSQFKLELQRLNLQQFKDKFGTDPSFLIALGKEEVNKLRQQNGDFIRYLHYLNKENRDGMAEMNARLDHGQDWFSFILGPITEAEQAEISSWLRV